jgi:hypothetical protein
MTDLNKATNHSEADIAAANQLVTTAPREAEAGARDCRWSLMEAFEGCLEPLMAASVRLPAGDVALRTLAAVVLALCIIWLRRANACSYNTHTHT